MAYSELLKDPRWQRKRLEIMKRDDFTCKRCGDNKNTLHVHHLIYRRGLKPWEYAGDELACWCENCHEEHHFLTEKVNDALCLYYKVYNPDYIRGCILAMLAEAAEIAEVEIENNTVAGGFGKLFGKSAGEIMSECVNGKLGSRKFFETHNLSSAWDILP